MEPLNENICNVPSLNDLIGSNTLIPKKFIDFHLSYLPPGDAKKYFPYQKSIHGAPIFLLDYYTLNFYQKEQQKHPQGEYKVFTWKRIFEELKMWAHGFQKGYDNFLNDKIIDSAFNNDKLTSQKIIDFLRSPFTGRTGFSICHDCSENPFKHWYNDGVEAGYIYRAWYIFFSNYLMFEDFFDSLSDPKSIPSPIHAGGEQVGLFSKILLEMNNPEIFVPVSRTANETIKRICDKYNIFYTKGAPRIRFGKRPVYEGSTFEKMKEQILDKIPDDDRKKIELYIDSKQIPIITSARKLPGK